MTVLVTRPQEKGKALCQLLNQAGITAIHQPLMRYQRGSGLLELPQIIGKQDIIIAVSQPAVSYGHEQLCQTHSPWPTTAQYVAIGQKTAQHLSKLTKQKVHYPENSDSEHLLDLPLLQSVDGYDVLILRGDNGRELIEQQLTARGASVRYCETYKRIFLTFDAELKIREWQSKQIDCIIFTSESLLNFFVSQFTQQHCTWLSKLQIVVPSHRIATRANQLGFTKTTIVGSANNFDLMAAIQPLVTGLTHDK